MNETTTPTEALVPVEEQIQQELVKHNVTEAKIAELKEKYLPLQISGPDDKETYLVVKEARKECKSVRIAAEKICKKGREEAVAIQKAWVAKEKDLSGRIGEVEDHLEKQEKEFEAAEKAEKERRKRQQDEQLILRQQILTGMGVLYSDGKFALGDASFEMSMIRECDNDIWEADILPHFQAEYEKVQAERIEQERIRQEREAEMKRQEEELKLKQLELAAREVELLKAKEEQERKEREEKERQEAAEQAAREAKIRSRIERVVAAGFAYQFSTKDHKAYDIVIHPHEIIEPSDEDFDQKLFEWANAVAVKKEEEEQQRLAEIEAQKEAERINTLRKSREEILKQYGSMVSGEVDLGTYNDDSWNTLLEEVKAEYDRVQKEKWEKEQEEKRKAEELKKQQEMEQAKEKTKWEDIIAQVNNIQLYEFRSAKYINKSKALKQLLDQIKAL